MNNKKKCRAVNGGPVSCVIFNTTYLAGIVSWDTNCADNYPIANTKVSAFADIINKAIYDCVQYFKMFVF